ncbi:serine/threonine-protein kinase SMG1-like [Armigeres subalbatus]|uniref:serine/threonine-protein kinase SMG1-like n=1 Tax=Armigeres subalbatus TaxID=124917 RepID=UPI002ED37D7A
MSAEQITGLDLNQATNACLHLSFTWRKMMKVKLLSEHILTAQISLTRSQMQFVAHSWLHELTTADSSTTASSNDLTIYADGSLILVQLKNIVESLTSSKISIQKLGADITTSTNAILHRLKWASGANPELVHLLKSFEQASLQKRDFLNEQLIYLDIALKHCSSVLNYQVNRMQINRHAEQDQTFVNMIDKYRKACTKLNSCSAMVNQTEVALVELLDPRDKLIKFG